MNPSAKAAGLPFQLSRQPRSGADDIGHLLRVILRFARRPLRCMTSAHKSGQDLCVPATADTARRACVAGRVRRSLHALIIPGHESTYVDYLSRGSHSSSPLKREASWEQLRRKPRSRESEKHDSRLFSPGKQALGHLFEDRFADLFVLHRLDGQFAGLGARGDLPCVRAL